MRFREGQSMNEGMTMVQKAVHIDHENFAMLVSDKLFVLW